MNKKTALITGGHGGLARSVAAGLTGAGFHVIAPGREKLDVTCGESVRAFFTGIQKIDVLINNAGLTAERLVGNLPTGQWDHTLSVNLRGAALCAAAGARALRDGGHLLFIGSLVGLAGAAGQSDYAAAKAGLCGLSASLAAEWAPHNVRVNTILPGFLETPMTRHLSPRVRRRSLSDNVLGRWNTPEEVARFITFLASTDHISGQIFQLDSRIRRIW